MSTQRDDEDLEARVIEQVNARLLPRKSSEVFLEDVPITLHPEVRNVALNQLRTSRVKLPPGFEERYFPIDYERILKSLHDNLAGLSLKHGIKLPPGFEERYFPLDRDYIGILKSLHDKPIDLSEYASQLKRIGLSEYASRLKHIDLSEYGSTLGWNIFWTQEWAAASLANRMGQDYKSFLGGRYLHYLDGKDVIEGLLGPENKFIFETGSGSGILDAMLAADGYIVRGVDNARMANRFAGYNALKFGVGRTTTPVPLKSVPDVPYFNIRLHLNRANISEDELVPLLKVLAKMGNYYRMDNIISNTFDAVVSFGVYEHENEEGLNRLLDGTIRIAKPGAWIVIGVPNEGGRFYEIFSHHRDYVNDRQYPGILDIPSHHTRHNLDVRVFMEAHGLINISEDAIQIAPSRPIRPGDILPQHLPVFAELPRYGNDLVEAWKALSKGADPEFRLIYGWSKVIIGQKPLEAPH